MNVTNQEDECTFCGNIVSQAIKSDQKPVGDFSPNICFNCVSKARRLVSEHNVNSSITNLDQVECRNKLFWF